MEVKHHFNMSFSNIIHMEHHPQTQVAKKMSPISGPKKPLFNGSGKPEEATHFMLRRFEIQPGGFIGVHSHPEEHQIFVIKGPIILIDGDENETQVNSEEFIYEPPFELHGYKNPNKFSVSFICGIPKLEKEE